MSKSITLDKVKTLLEPILHIIGKKAERPSWDENDPGSASYIAGRTHYTEEKFKEITKISQNFEQPVEWDQPLSGYIVEPIGTFTLVPGRMYTVVYDGEKHELGAYVEVQFDNVVVGNGALVGAGNEDNGLPFAVGVYKNGDTDAYAIASTSGMHTFSIGTTETVVHQMEGKYLPANGTPYVTLEQMDAFAGEMEDVVRYNSAQGLTTTQKNRARSNIGAGTSNFSGSYSDLSNKPSVVLYTEQTITGAQMIQARKNIGAAGTSEAVLYTKQSKSEDQKKNARGNIGAKRRGFGSFLRNVISADSGYVGGMPFGYKTNRANDNQSCHFYTDISNSDWEAVTVGEETVYRLSLGNPFNETATNGNIVNIIIEDPAYMYDGYDVTTSVHVSIPSESDTYYGDYSLYTTGQEGQYGFLLLRPKGAISKWYLYMKRNTATAFSFDGITNESRKVIQLDEKFIPDTIQRVGSDVIIPSSTEGSTKQFKITVDDSGMLTATEVT